MDKDILANVRTEKLKSLGDQRHWRKQVKTPYKIYEYNAFDNTNYQHEWLDVQCGLHHTILINQFQSI